MKLNKTLSLVILSVLPAVAHGQSYTETAPITFETGINALGSTEVISTTGTLTETVTINPTADTIEQAGTISIGAANWSTFNASQTQTITIAEPFPNPPQIVQVPGSLTIGGTSSAQTVSFDSGAEPFTYSGANSWTFPASRISIDLALGLAYSLTTGGQTYTGEWSSGLDSLIQLPYQLNTANYPASISLNPTPELAGIPGAGQVADFTAADGFVTDISLVPEPNTFALLGVVVTAFGVLRRK